MVVCGGRGWGHYLQTDSTGGLVLVRGPPPSPHHLLASEEEESGEETSALV